ncbi:hypothetical protein GCM10025867_46620 (plasmid) [Frondihabitans sucicola]|uniref:Uncharacterized protein n=1 Tax=Frondihabitans sucicola TaxID=1268041 RepID=A0ABN6Y5L3_9MICO|nr:hypothetical protein [Frondihabitans sucicola]BDZ52421.1 hypothetical protein GCM10025867_46620 [Frondihabitans sucicola]
MAEEDDDYEVSAPEVQRVAGVAAETAEYLRPYMEADGFDFSAPHTMEELTAAYDSAVSRANLSAFTPRRRRAQLPSSGFTLPFRPWRTRVLTWLVAL